MSGRVLRVVQSIAAAGATFAFAACASHESKISETGSMPTKQVDFAADAGRVVCGNARFTVLTPRLIRMEWSPTARFEDRPSFAFTQRDVEPPAFEAKTEGGRLLVETSDLKLVYSPDGRAFSNGNLAVSFKMNGATKKWAPGADDAGNLGGTVRTLDQANGRVPLDPGLVSRDGWVVVDDSKTLLFGDGDPAWPAVRKEPDALDWYFFGHGHDYAGALRDFTKVAGEIPLPPRYVFGAWWSRYWHYSDQELKDLVAAYREHDVPLDILVVDMDWHLVGPEYPQGGWTGYTWDPKLFPDPAGFLKWASDEGLRTTLNLHPHSGVGPHEAQYADFARAMGIDPATKAQIPFDCADRKYMDAYFKLLHHPYEVMGIDFWWLDWQQGTETDIPGLDPLFWLNHLHWIDMERNPLRQGLRPLIFSRWGGLGNHRYQIGFSGDTWSTWESLKFQSEFTATASNVGYGLWSHDIGGHIPGKIEPEIYARWIQMAIFSPALRTHTTKNPEAERRIWAFDDEIFQAAREAFHLRYRLIPYVYTAAREAHDTSVSMCRPLYYEWPELSEAYEWGDEFMFGDELLVAPVSSPRDATSGCALRKAWLPPGQWTEWTSGREFVGPCVVELAVALDETPVFGRAGGILPLGPKMMSSSEKPVDPVELVLFPGESGAIVGAPSDFELYEDDGTSLGYKEGRFARTRYTQRRTSDKIAVGIEPAVGEYDGMVEERAYILRLPNVLPPKRVTLNGAALAASAIRWVDGDLLVDLPRASVRERRDVIVESSGLANPYEPDLLNGLKGRLKKLDDVERAVGDAMPARFAELRRMRTDAGASAEKALALAKAVNGDAWLALCDEVADCSAPEDRKLKALARMLGLSVDLAARAAGDAKGAVDMRAEMRLLDAARDFEGTLTTKAPAGWSQPDGPAASFSGKGGGDAATAFVRLVPPDGAQTAVLRANLALNVQGRTFEVPFEQTLFPSINDWRVVGPFENPWEIGLTKVHPPEGKIDFAASYPGKDGGAVSWKRAQRLADDQGDLAKEFVVDLHEVTGGRVESTLAYAVTWLDAPKDMDVVFAIGSDDGFALRVNGEWVETMQKGRPYVSRENKVPARLKKGRNEVLMKVSQGGGDWKFAVHVEDANGRAAEGVSASAE